MTAQPAQPTVRTGGVLFYALLSVFSGLMLSLQSRINGALAGELGDAMAAATLSFGVGVVALILIALLVPKVRKNVAQVPHALRERRFPSWYLLAGGVGALIVFSQSAVVPMLGVALYTVCLVTGQSIGSMFMDLVGFGGAIPRKINTLRVVGVVLTIAGVVWAVSPRGGEAQLSALLFPMIFALVVGTLMGFQGAANGAQSAAYGGATAATLVNFVVGFLILGIVMLIRMAGHVELNPLPGSWWYYSGGILGCLFVGLTAMVIKRLGVLVTSLAAVGGQLVGSLLLDVVVPTAGSSVSAATILGTALTLSAVVLTSVSANLGSKPKATALVEVG